MNRHPVAANRITFETAPLYECVAVFKDRIANGERGMLIYGPPKQGVSTACRHICAGMREAGRSVVLATQAVRGDDLPVRVQTDSLWRQLIPPDAIVASYVSRLQDALMRYIEVDADLLKTRHVILVIDRAENISLRQWEALRNLVEELRSVHQFSCFCLIAGQSELLAAPRRFRRVLRHALVAEFFLSEHRFRGLQLEELADVLAFYDSLRHPLPDGPTYTEHYLPRLWARGLRLASFAGPMRDRFGKIFKATGRGTVELPMEYVASAARRFLFSAETWPRTGAADLADHAVACADQCGLREALAILGNPEAEAIEQGASRRLNQR